MKTNRLARFVLAAGISMLAATAARAADEQASRQPEEQEFRKYLKTARKQMVAAHMELTDGEAERFWPVYDQFAEELSRIDLWKAALTRDYVRQYRTLSDRQAEVFLEQRAAMEQAANELRLKYIPLFRKVLSGKSTALFYQIEWRLNLMIEMQWTSEIPLIEPSGSDQWRILPSENPL